MVTINITKSHIKKARNIALVGFGLAAVGGVGYVALTGPAGRQIMSYGHGVLEAVGVEDRTTQNDTIEGAINEAADRVQDYFERNNNRMAQGRGENFPFIMLERLVGVENLFLENGRPEAKAEYIEDRLDPVQMEQLLHLYSQTASMSSVVDLAANLYQTAESFVVDGLDAQQRNAHYVGRCIYGLENDLLNESGQTALLTEIYGAMGPEQVSETCMPYATQTPATRDHALEMVVESMSDDEKAEFAQAFLGTLSQDQYDAVVLEAFDGISREGYEQLEDQMSQRARQGYIDGAHRVLDKVSSLIGGE